MFPEGLPTVLVSYTAASPAGGVPASGAVEFAPSVPVVTVDGYDEVFTGRGTYQESTLANLDARGLEANDPLPGSTAPPPVRPHEKWVKGYRLRLTLELRQPGAKAPAWSRSARFARRPRSPRSPARRSDGADRRCRPRAGRGRSA